MSGRDSREIALYRAAQDALLGLIDPSRQDSPLQAIRRSRAAERLQRTHALLASLGNPHLAYPVVHVTGTSGKGSTCAAIAAMLSAAGYRVGLRTSPYLQVATEKLQIGDALIDATSFADQTRAVLATAAGLQGSGAVRGPSYAEIWTALSLSWFAQREVDIAVVEVGAGGRFDATNVVQPIVSVITSVGLDHIVSLGPSIADIAWHKAGIIKPGSIAVIGGLPAEADMIVREAAVAARAPLIRATEVTCPLDVTSKSLAAFQRQNAQVAAAVVEALRTSGMEVPGSAIRAGLAAARLPGRLEAMPQSTASRVWIDGAHNPDKIAALAQETGMLAGNGQLPVVVLGVLAAKDFSAIAATAVHLSSAIVATQPSVVGKTSLPASALAQQLRDLGFAGHLVTEPNPREAIIRAQAMARLRDCDVLVTGSLYLAGEIRRRWYPDDEIVIQRTPWPDARGEVAAN